MVTQLSEDGRYLVTTDPARLQIDRVHHYLSTEAYWCLGIPHGTVERAIRHSLCFSLVEVAQETQVGFCRVVTDFATFAWICDVYVERDHRGSGLATWLMEIVMAELSAMKLRRICLATKDAHGLYRKFGLEVTQAPDRWMELKLENAYGFPAPAP